MTIKNSWNKNSVKPNVRKWITKAFLTMVLLIVGLLVFAHTPYLQGGSNSEKGAAFSNPTFVTKRCIYENRSAPHLSDYKFMAQESDIQEPSLIISEFMAINGSKQPLTAGELLDEDGDSSDWIEIYNPTETTIDLDGWYLTESTVNLRQWEFPSVKIQPDKFMIIFASGKDRDDPDDELHTNFKLTGSAGFLALVKPDGETIEYAYEYPQQFGNFSYGLSSGSAVLATEITLIEESAPAKALIPTDNSLGLSWTEPAFNDSQWRSGKTGVGYDYGDLIGLDVSAMRNVNRTVYVRIPFLVVDVSVIDELTLRMKYEDGFVAYLNGHELGSDNAPGSHELTWNSGSNGNRDDSIAVNFQDFDITPYKDFLVLGLNVLAIHGLNGSMGSSDLLILPELIATELESIELSADAEGYFERPTPGGKNSGAIPNLGPAIRNVTENPPQPNSNEDLIIRAEITETFEPLAEVLLGYYINFSGTNSITMFDDGLHNDGAANDNIYAATIPADKYGPGDMVRWKIMSFDTQYNISNNPSFLIKDGRIQSPEYFGTVVADPSIRTALPVFHYFVENTGAAGSRSGTRASVFYDGEFYDNVFVRLRGGYTTHGRKFEFNDGHHFLFDPNLPRVDEINLNERGAEPTYIRQVLGWETYVNAGQPGSLSFPMHVRRNGSYHAVRIFIEQPDRDLLRRNNLDPDGALYKMYDDLQNGRIDGEGVHRKKNRLDEDSSDLLALAGGIDTRNSNRNQFVFDNVNIPATINYWASSVIMHENDHTHKNYYAYRDTWDPVNNPGGTNEWTFLPWDKDLTFGINNGIPGVIADQDWPGNVRSPSHPFYGCSEHQKRDYQWNCLIDALHDNEVIRRMYLRRLRTLMDELLQPPNTPLAQRKFEKRIDELKAQLDIELGSSGWYNNLERIKNDYLTVRRRHLFQNHSIHNPNYNQNAGIPDAQPENVTVNFGSVDFNPVSGNQDEEYIELSNPNTFEVEISGWSLQGGVEHLFPPGTVIPRYGKLYVTPNAVVFRNRSQSPRGGQQLFVQGNYKGHLSSWGETINLLDSNGTPINSLTYPGNPSDQQRYLRITEVMFNPAEGDVFDSQDYEYIELKNIGTAPLPLTGVKFTDGISFNLPGITLAAGDFVLVVKNQAAFASRYTVPGDVQVLGPYEGLLSNSGENLKLEDSTNSTVLEFDYNDGWYDITDGMDFSLTVKDPTSTDLDQWNSKSNWRSSAETGGSPGWDDTGELPALGEVVINELLAHSHAGAPDWIELHNTTDTAVNIGGWFLSDSSIDFMKYEIAAGTTIEPHDYIVFYEDLHFGNPDDPGCHVPFALSENSETLYLHSGRDGVLTGYSDQENFDASETGVAFGRYQKSTGTYNFVAMSQNTPGSANAYPKVGPIVISEIMYNPVSGNQDQEYVELLNITDSVITLAEYDNELFIDVPWRFADDSNGINFDFPLGTTMAPGEYLLLVRDMTAFDSANPDIPNGIQILEWGPGRLSNAGEKLQLSKPGDQVEDTRYYIRIDRVNYSDGSHPAGEDPWPTEPDDSDKSLMRIVPADYGNDPDNWTAANPSPGE
ncbi:lamin tail domain-containing protein [Planctomycetota bacterium]